MANRSPFDRRILGGLSPDAFLDRHWQRAPLLVRGAFAPLPALPDREALFALAARDEVESRLITSFDGRWTMTCGPIARVPRRKRDWTLLVQGVNLYDARTDALMRRFDFISAMRLDDLMISYAADGGSVGPHFDSYDVFLLQIDGARRWRWRGNPLKQRDLTLIDGAPLKLLEHFTPTDEAVLEPGDMLYLPPHCAHEGIAIGACMTASIGFRAPSWNELAQDFLFAMAEREWLTGRYTDRGRRPARAPAAIDRDFVDAVSARLSRVRWTRDDVEDFIGRHFSEPKPHVFFDAPRAISQTRFAAESGARGLALDLKTTMLYRGRRGYICGEAFAMPAAGRDALVRLADERRLDASIAAAVSSDAATCKLLHEWWNNGWILFASSKGSR